MNKDSWVWADQLHVQHMAAVPITCCSAAPPGLQVVLTPAAVWVCVVSRYEKRHTNISAHISPAFRCKEGDTVVIGQCRCALSRFASGAEL
jgi:hypothetical protein